MKTYTKRDLAELVGARYTAESKNSAVVSSHALITLVNSFVTMLSDTLVEEKKTVYLRGWGKLTPTFKAGGRPVRNPRDPSESLIMPDHWTVTKTGTAENNSDNKLHYSKMIIWVEEYVERNIKGCNSRAMSLCFMSTLIDMLVSLGNEDRIEFRGLGVFYNKLLQSRLVRNPKTGEKILKEPSYHSRFKVSKVILDRLNS